MSITSIFNFNRILFTQFPIDYYSGRQLYPACIIINIAVKFIARFKLIIIIIFTVKMISLCKFFSIYALRYQLLLFVSYSLNGQ